MADNTTLQTTLATPPSGLVIATDDVSSVHFQKIKIADGAADSSAMIGGDATNGLDVDVTRVGGNVTVVQATAANLNVTEASGAAAAASLAVLDDWDESDRAKVNPIVGQAGVAAGAGVVGATVQRVTLASDDPAVASLQTLDNAIAGSEMQVDVVAALPAGTNNIGDVDVLSIAAGDNNIGNVDLASAIPAGTNNIGDVDVASIAAGDNNIGNVDVVTLPGVAGDVAHDLADSGNPVKMGAKAVTADPTAVAANDRVNVLADSIGRQVIAPYALHENLVRGNTSDITGTSDTEVIAAQGAGVRIYVTHILVGNSHATVSTWVNIKDGSTTIYTGYAAAAGGGFSATLPAPLRLTANTALNAACVTTGANVRVSASGYKSAV